MSHSRGLLVAAASLLSSLIVCSVALAQETATAAELTPGRTFQHALILNLSFSAGDAFLACSDTDYEIEVLNLSTGETVWSWKRPELLTTSRGDLVWSPVTWTPDTTLPDYLTRWPGRVMVKFPPHDLQRLAIAHKADCYTHLLVKEGERTVRLPGYWRLGGYVHLYQGPQFEHAGWLELREPERLPYEYGTFYGGLPVFEALEFSPVEPIIATGDTEGYLSLWSALDNSWVGRERGDRQPLRAVAFNPLGNRLATIGDTGIVRLWSVEKLELLAELEGHEATTYLSGNKWIEFSADGSCVASAPGDGTLRVWNVAKACEEACIKLPPELGENPRFAFASGSDWLYAAGGTASGAVLGRIHFDTGLFAKLLDLPDRTVRDMVCSPSRNFLAVGDNRQILTWHVRPPALRSPATAIPAKHQGLPKMESP